METMNEILRNLGIEPDYVKEVRYLRGNKVKVVWKDGVAQTFIINPDRTKI